MVLRTPMKIDQPVKILDFCSKKADLLPNFSPKLQVRFTKFKNLADAWFFAQGIMFRHFQKSASVMSYSENFDTERAPLQTCFWTDWFYTSGSIFVQKKTGLVILSQK